MPLYEIFDTSVRRRKEISKIKSVRDFLQTYIDYTAERNQRNRGALRDLGIALERYKSNQANGLLAFDRFLNAWGSSGSKEVQNIKTYVIELKGDPEAFSVLQDIYANYIRSESDLHLAYGDKDASEGQMIGAFDYYRQAKNIDPSNARALTTYARELMIRKKFAEAEDILRCALNLSPEDPRILLTIGVCQMESKQMPKAIETFNKLVQYRPQYAPTYLLLAEIYQSGGHTKDANICYMQAGEFALRGDPYLDPEEAKVILDIAMARSPKKRLMLPAPKPDPGADAAGSGPGPLY
ncbi:MAG: hypothetical protein DYH13_06830 [Alphaproteobacteria bacterium PRO2]|nr:hypothetical protein [Alphaproteobacteria bacterium PRO2]